MGSAISNAFGGGDISFDIKGGSTSQSGSVGTLVLNGFVQTGLQKDKSLTVSYAPGATTGGNVVLDGNIKANVSGPVSVGQDILSRIDDVELLKSQYSSDAIAVGAYNAELKFLYAEAAGMGLGTVSTVNGQLVFTLNSQVTAATSTAAASAALNSAQLQASTGQVNFGIALQLSPSTTGTASAATIASDIQDGTYGILVTSANALAALQKMSGSADAYKDAKNTAVSTAVTDVATQRNLISGYGTTISNAATAISTAQADIVAKTKVIVDNQKQVTANQISGADTSQLLLAIGTAKSAIATDLATIQSKTGDINTAIGSLSTANTKLGQDLATIKAGSAKTQAETDAYNALTAYTAASGDSAPAFGALGGLSAAVDNITSQASVVTTAFTQTVSQITTLTNTTNTNPGTSTLNTDHSGQNSLNQWVGLLASQGATVVQDTSALNNPPSSGSLQTYQIKVEDTATRLGNISLVADVATGSGTGELHAPGDASITIVNKTADELDLGNLANPSYEAGRVRFNGVITNAASDINRLDGGSLALHAMETSTGAVPSITITSLYDPGDSAYANATPSNAAKVAPDIVLAAGKSISNPSGALNITSEAGNIFLRGTVDAGSVNILAKNGDFSTSYTNTFEHAGGDPAAGLPTGAGITANGAVFISARYLDINSTIQSGIVQWQLGLTTNTSLTAIKPTDIGVSQADFDAAVTLAKSASTKIAQLSSVNGAYGSGIWVDASGKTPTLEFSQAYAEAYAANHTAAAYNVVNPNNTIGATYDANAKIFLVDNTAVHGGSVTLYGQILNTSFQGTDNGHTYTSAGQINVLDGFGTININNTTGHAVILSNLDAGADPTGTGRGTAGIIDITDVHQVTGGVHFTETVYTRAYTPGAGGDGTLTAAVTQWEILTSGAEVDLGTSSSSTDGRSTHYDPLAGERYVWTSGTNYATTTTWSHTEDVIFGNDDWNFNNISSITGSTTNVTSSYRLQDGTYLTTDATQKNNSSVNPSTNGIIISTTADTVSNTAQSTEDTRLITSVDDYNTSTDARPVKTGEHTDCNWWTLCIDAKKTAYYQYDQTYTEITTNSLKGDNPIGINFIGSNTGSIAVNSNSNVVLDGAITNHAGTTTIAATGSVTSGGVTTPNSIIQGSNGALITSKSVDLEAAGSVGGITSPYSIGAPPNAAVAVALAQTIGSDQSLNAPAGSLTAIASSGNVVIRSPGTLNVATVKASGSVAAGTGAVSLAAGGSILAASDASLVQAHKVTLTAANGAIGGTTALNVNTGYTDDQALRPFGDPATASGLNVNYGLTAYAAGSINVSSSKWDDNADGSILVNQVVSSGGDVTLSSTGHILDNNPDQTVDQKSYADLLGYWNSLGLLAGAANTTKTDQAIAAFEQSKTNDFNQYWQIRRGQANGGVAYDPNYQVTIGKGSAEYNALYDYFSGQPSPKSIEQRIADYAASETATYHALNAEVGTLPAPTVDPVTKALVPYHYTATTAEVDALKAGSTWSEKELALALSAGALKTVTSTNPVLKDPNVSGQNVKLVANVGIGETAGSPANPGLQIAWGTQVGTLTDDEKVALAAAERPDLTLTVSGFETLSDTELAGLTSAQRTAYAAALAAWNAAGITGPVVIHLGSVENTAQTVTPQLLRERAALKAAAAGFVVGQGTYLSILPKRPLNVAVIGSLDVDVSGTGANDATTGQTHPTQDDGAAYLASRGSLALGTVSVAGDTRIKVAGSLSNAANSAINTGDIILEAAQGAIGDLAGSHALQLDKVGAIVARALNGVDLAVAGNAAVDTIYSPGNVRLEATQSITNANTDSLINILGTNVTLVADGGSIGTAGNRLNVGVNLEGGITATALNGSVNLYGPAGNSFVIDAVTAGTTVDLAAAGDGTIDGHVKAGGDVRLAAGVAPADSSTRTKLGLTGRAAVISAAGNVVVTADTFKMLNGAVIAPTVGTVSITAAHDALVTGISSTNAAQDAVAVISTGGHVFAGTDPDRQADITALKGGVVVQAAQGIGDKTEADLELADLPTEPKGSADAVTDVANPLRIDSGKLQLTAQAGDLDVQTGVAVTSATVLASAGNIGIDAFAAFHGSSLKSPLGSVRLTGAGAVTIDTLGAGTAPGAVSGAIAVTASKGPLTIGTATSGGTQTLRAQDDVHYTTLATTGLAGDVGDIALTSQKGSVSGSSLDAHNGAVVTGLDLDLDTVTAGTSADLEASNSITGTFLKTGAAGTLKAGASVTWTTADIGTSFDATTSGGPLTLTTATSGGTQMLTSKGFLSFAQLTSKAGDIIGRSTPARSRAGPSRPTAPHDGARPRQHREHDQRDQWADRPRGGRDHPLEQPHGARIDRRDLDGRPISVVTATSGGSRSTRPRAPSRSARSRHSASRAMRATSRWCPTNGAVNGGDVDANGRLDVFGNGVTFRRSPHQGNRHRLDRRHQRRQLHDLGRRVHGCRRNHRTRHPDRANLMLTTPGRIHFSNPERPHGRDPGRGVTSTSACCGRPRLWRAASVTLTG